MKRTIVFIAILFGLLAACHQTNRKDDPEQLKSVLMDYFNGIKTKDFQKMNDVTTSDFLLYENGKIFNNDSLFNMLNNFSKFKAEYKFDNFRINFDDTIGNMIYTNHGEFIINDTTHLTLNWLESAHFKKVGGKWKLDFLHSTERTQ